MKRILLVILSLLTLSSAEVFAQQRSAKKSITLGAIDCKAVQTYSYIESNGKQILDGPVSVKGSRTYNSETYGPWSGVRGTTSYTLSAEHSKGDLHGAISMKYSCNMKAANNISDSRTITYSGNFSKSMPDGRFQLEIKANYMEPTIIDVTYRNGIFTGPFRLKFESWEWTDIEGSFTHNGRLDGKWSITYKNREGKSGSDTYHFQNGVLIGGGGGSIDATTKSYAVKYAKGELSQKELAQKGYFVEKDSFCIYSNRTDLYRFVAEKLFGWSYINYDALGGVYWYAANADERYEYLTPIPYFTDEGFKAYTKSLLESGWPIKSHELVNIGDICLTHKSLDLRYVEELSYNANKPVFDHLGKEWRSRDNIYGYFLTEAQVAELKSAIEQHNIAAEKAFEQNLRKNAEKHFAEGSRFEMGDYRYYNVLSYRVLEYHNRIDGMTAEMDCRPHGIIAKVFETYRCEIKAKDNDPAFITTKFTKIRNICDDIADIKADLAKADEKVAAKTASLIAQHKADTYAAWNRQLQLYTAFRTTNLSIADSSEPTQETYDIYKLLLKECEAFPLFMEYYTLALLEKNPNEEKLIAENTLTNTPELADWHPEYNIGTLNDAAKEIRATLNDWKTYCEEAKRANAAHKKIVDSNMADEVIIEDYMTLYNDNTKRTIKDGTAHLGNICEKQELLLKQWASYRKAKQVAAQKHKSIVNEDMASEVIINDYIALYNDKTKRTIDKSLVAINDIIELQEYLLKQWTTYKEAKQVAQSNHKRIAGTNMTSTVIIDDYISAYNNNLKSKVIVEEGLRNFNDIIALQDYILKQWESLKKIVKLANDNHTLIANEDVASVVVIDSYMNLYTTANKSKVGIDESIKRYNSVIEQQNLLMQKWPTYKELRAKAAEAHGRISDEHVEAEVLLTSYLSAYGDKAKLEIDESIQRLQTIREQQDKVLELWDIYKKTKSLATSNHNYICSEKMESEILLGDYMQIYDNAQTKVIVEVGITRFNDIVKIQEGLLKHWPNYKMAKKEAFENHNLICKESIESEVVIDNYLNTYTNHSTTKLSVEESVKRFNNLIEMQNSILKQWPTYKELKKAAAEKHTLINNSKIGNEVVINDYLGLYNDKSKLAVEESITRLNKIIKLQYHLLNLWPKYKELKRQAIENHKHIINSQSMVTKNYVAHYNEATKTKSSVEDDIVVLNKLITIQKEVAEYIVLHNQVMNNNGKLMLALRPAKSAAKAYRNYYKSFDFQWKEYGNNAATAQQVLAKQKELLQISKRPNLKEEEKQIKKLKLTNLDDIIRAYK